MSDTDKICESCDAEFVSYVETICEDCFEEHDKDVTDTIAKLKAERDRYRDALEFYADKNNWYSSDDFEGDDCMEIKDHDGYRLEENNILTGGNRAREALEPKEQGE